MRIEILRVGHRKQRDARLSTHVALIARALGAKKLFYTGEQDAALEESVGSISRKWGGKFSIEHAKDDFSFISARKKAGWKIVHLTMYGMPLAKKLSALRKSKRLLIVVGGAKVPYWLYEEADANVAVSNQPHSEAGALAVVLHELARGRYPAFAGVLRIVPCENGKEIKEYKPKR